MGNFQVTTLTCWKFFLQTVHEKSFLKASEKPQKKYKEKKKLPPKTSFFLKLKFL